MHVCHLIVGHGHDVRIVSPLMVGYGVPTCMFMCAIELFGHGVSPLMVGAAVPQARFCCDRDSYIFRHPAHFYVRQ